MEENCFEAQLILALLRNPMRTLSVEEGTALGIPADAVRQVVRGWVNKIDTVFYLRRGEEARLWVPPPGSKPGYRCPLRQRLGRVITALVKSGSLSLLTDALGKRKQVQ